MTSEYPCVGLTMPQPAGAPSEGFVACYRAAQDTRWGAQDHPIFPSNMDPESYRAYHREQADMWKRVNANRASLGLLSFDGVLMEEVEEMLAEAPGSPEFRAEGIQVSAVAALIVEAHDRRVAGEQEKAS